MSGGFLRPRLFFPLTRRWKNEKVYVIYIGFLPIRKKSILTDIFFRFGKRKKSVVFFLQESEKVGIVSIFSDSEEKENYRLFPY